MGVNNIKYCKKCHRNLSLQSFREVESRLDGLARYCKSCDKVISKKYYLRNERAFLVKLENNKNDILNIMTINHKKVKMEIPIVLPWKEKPTVYMLNIIKGEGKIICKESGATKKALNKIRLKIKEIRKEKIVNFKINIIEICSKKKQFKIKFNNWEYVENYLKINHCADCGENNPIVLEFDHVRGTKLYAISELKRKSTNLKKLEEEINKCEVRCANCHRKVTHLRRLSSIT